MTNQRSLDDAPGVEIPGYEGLYRIDRQGVVWSRGRNGRANFWSPRRPASRNTYMLVSPAAGRRTVCCRVADLLHSAYGDDAPPAPRMERGVVVGSTFEPAPPPEQPDDYPPPPPMTDAERWQHPRRVVWPVRDVFGQAVGQRDRLLWVVLDGETVPRLIALNALAYVPGPDFEAAYKRRLREIELDYWRLGRLYAGQQQAAGR